MCLCKGGNYNGFPIGFLIPAANNEFILCSLFCWSAGAPLRDSIQHPPAPGPSKYILNEMSYYLDNRWAHLFKEEALRPDTNHKEHCLQSVWELQRAVLPLLSTLVQGALEETFQMTQASLSVWGGLQPEVQATTYISCLEPNLYQNHILVPVLQPKYSHTISSMAAIPFPNIVYLVFILEQLSGVRFLPVKALTFPLPDSKWIIYGLISEIDINWC